MSGQTDVFMLWPADMTGGLKCCVCGVCSKMWSRDLVDAELDALVSAFKAKGIARVNYKRAMSCVSLICNVEKTSQILERVSHVGQPVNPPLL